MTGSMPTFCGALFFTLAGLWLFLSGIKEYRDSIDSKEWHSINGRIISATIHRSLARGMPYYVKVVYSYSHLGQTYLGGQVVFGSVVYSSKKEAEAVMRRYPPHQEVMVYYNPKDHRQTVLEPGRMSGAVGHLIGGAFFLLGGGILLVMEIWNITQYLSAR